MRRAASGRVARPRMKTSHVASLSFVSVLHRRPVDDSRSSGDAIASVGGIGRARGARGSEKRGWRSSGVNCVARCGDECARCDRGRRGCARARPKVERSGRREWREGRVIRIGLRETGARRLSALLRFGLELHPGHRRVRARIALACRGRDERQERKGETQTYTGARAASHHSLQAKRGVSRGQPSTADLAGIGWAES